MEGREGDRGGEKEGRKGEGRREKGGERGEGRGKGRGREGRKEEGTPHFSISSAAYGCPCSGVWHLLRACCSDEICLPQEDNIFTGRQHSLLCRALY